jgi:hypothetical protein
VSISTKTNFVTRPGSPRAATGHARIELARGWEAIEQLEGDWDRLSESHSRPVPWAGFAAVRAMKATWAEPWEPIVAAVVVGKVPRLLVPLEARRRTAFTMVRGMGRSVFGRFEPLVAGDVAGAASAVVFRAIARRLRREALFDLSGLWPGAPGTAWLQAGIAGRPGWFVAEGALDYEIPLEATWPAMHASIRRSFRDRASRGLEVARRREALVTRVWRPADPGEFRFLVELSQRRGRFLDQRAGRAAVRLAEESICTGRLLLACASHDGTPVAGVAVWIWRGEAVELLGAADPGKRELAADEVLRIELLRALVEREGARAIVLPSGDHPRAVGLCAAPQRQLRFWGAPYPGSLRLAARMAAWYGREDQAGPAMVRAVLSLLRTRRARLRRRLSRGRS